MTPAPTYVRYRVLGMLFLLSMITYLDRVCIGSAAPAMRKDLGLDPLQLGLVFSAFQWAYAIFEIPSGWMGDRYGPRKTLTRIVIWWSVFTALTGRVNGLLSLWITRFLFGAGEAGAYPNSSASISRWFPFSERARAQGMVWMASRLGGAIAPLIVVPLQARLGWRMVFMLFGAIGFVWALAWYLWYRDDPKDKPTVNQAELAIIRDGGVSAAKHGDTPWGVLLTSWNLWAVTLMYFTYGYGVQLFFFWMPSYLVEARGLTNFAPYAALPFVLGALTNAAGGWTSDALSRRIGLRWGRRTVGLIGLGGSVVLVVGSLFIQDPATAVIMLCCAFAFTDFMLPTCWAVCLDIGKRYAGTVTGFMNTAAQVGGAIAATVIGYLARQKQWDLAIMTMAGALLISALFYLVIDASRPLIRETEHPASSL